MFKSLAALRSWLTSLKSRHAAVETRPADPDRLGRRLYRALVVTLVLFGIFLRLRGFAWDGISLWLDEAFWAVRLMHLPLEKMVIRPIGFMWATRALATQFGPSEFWLRLIPNAASIATLLLVPYVARRLMRSRFIAVLVLFAFAAHPALIDLSREFKPYSLDVLVHFVPLALYLRHRETGRLRPLMLGLVWLPPALLFAYNATFLLPGVLGVTAYRVVATRAPRLRRMWAPLLATAACAGICLSILLVLQSTTLERAGSAKSVTYWSHKYDVFYPPKGHHARYDTRVAWTTAKYNDMAATPGIRRERWELPLTLRGEQGDELRAAERLVWVLLHILAVTFLVRRRRIEEAILLLSPWVLMIAFNVAGKWPLGAFRTNLFIVPYAILIASLGVVSLANTPTRGWRWAVLVAAAMFFVAPTMCLGFDWAAQKGTWTAHSEFRTVIERLRRLREDRIEMDPGAPREIIIADGYSAHSYQYYLKEHPTVAKQRAFFKKNYRLIPEWGRTKRIEKEIASRLRKHKRPVWVLISKRKYIEPVIRAAKKKGQILHEERIADTHLILQVAPKKQAKRRK